MCYRVSCANGFAPINNDKGFHRRPPGQREAPHGEHRPEDGQQGDRTGAIPVGVRGSVDGAVFVDDVVSLVVRVLISPG